MGAVAGQEQIELHLPRHGVRAIGTLFVGEAPRTVQAVSSLLPLEIPISHATWAGREIYGIVDASHVSDPGPENQTVMPVPGDLMLFYFRPGQLEWPADLRAQAATALIDIAVFYGRNSYLLSSAGYAPGNLFGSITGGLTEFAAACDRIWRNGSKDEALIVRRHDVGR